MKNFLTGRQTPARRKTQPWILLTAGLLMCAPAFSQGGGQGGRPGGDGPRGDGGGPRGGGPRGGGQGGDMGGGGNQMGGPRGGNRGDRAQMREQMTRNQLNRAGYTDEALQTAVVAYVKTKESGRQALYDAANNLSEGLSDEATTDAQIGTLYDTFAAALSAEKTRVQTAENQLDTQIKFSADKRLMAVLTLTGVIGDAMTYLSSGNQGGGRGGMGGPGGGMGGPGGGMGGPPPPPPPPRDGGMGGPPPPPPPGEMD